MTSSFVIVLIKRKEKQNTWAAFAWFGIICNRTQLSKITCKFIWCMYVREHKRMDQHKYISVSSWSWLQMQPCQFLSHADTSFYVQLMLNVTFPRPITYEIYKHVSLLSFYCFSPHTCIINIWEDGCLGLTYAPSEMSLAPRVANMLLTEHQNTSFGIHNCWLMSWLDMNMAALNMCSPRAGYIVGP